MKKLLAVSVFAALPYSASAADINNDFNFIQDSAPVPSVVGHLELSLGWENVKADGGGEEDLGRFGGHGRVNIPFAGNWNLELETGGVALFHDGDSSSNIGVYGHLWGDWYGFRAGAFGGVDFFNFGEVGSAGLEAEVDVGNVTLGVLGHYTQQLDCGSCYLWGVMGWADLYVTPDTRLGIEGRYADAEGGQSTWGVAGTAEQRFSGTPISLFVRGGYEELSDSGFETITVLGGLRIFMDGGMTLQEHDHQVPFKFQLPEFVNVLNFFDGFN